MSAGAAPAVAALHRIGRQPLSWSACVATTAVLLALLLTAAVVAWNLRALLAQPGFSAEATVFLAPGATAAEAGEMRAPLLGLPAVSSLRFIDRDAAIAQVARDLGDPATDSAALADLDSIPLPYAWVLEFASGADPGQVEAALESARKLRGVDSVVADLRWYRNWLRLVQFASAFAACTAALALLGTLAWGLLTASAWVRLDAGQLRLLDTLGADDAWIISPQVHLGALTGLAAGLAALGLYALVIHGLLPAASVAVAALRSPSPFIVLPPPWTALPWTVAVSVLAAAATSLVARAELRSLRRARPPESAL